jgi:elongation factor P hydroxylase
MNLVIADDLRLNRVVDVFDRLFCDQFNTRLQGGAAEPIYIPAGDLADGYEICDYHRLYFREDYFSSALHESAHWCIAGSERRLQVDFGYWYNPDGRSQQQQRVFERAETKPQALEWMFSLACGQKFSISADNLASDLGASEDFIHAVVQQAQDWCCGSPMPPRGDQFLQALMDQFEKTDIKCVKQYQQAKLV